MNLAFTLSMPNNNSWNGKWSGASKLYVIVRGVGTSKRVLEKHRPLVGKAFYYNFGDGWGASVSVREVVGKEVTALRKRSAGFCGYDWMIDEILLHGRILTLKERDKAA
jgi:hypothetical protein